MMLETVPNTSDALFESYRDTIIKAMHQAGFKGEISTDNADNNISGRRV